MKKTKPIYCYNKETNSDNNNIMNNIIIMTIIKGGGGVWAALMLWPVIVFVDEYFVKCLRELLRRKWFAGCLIC